MEINKLLTEVHKNYNAEDFFGKFKQRFFLKEVCRQLQTLYQPVDSAISSLEIYTQRRHAKGESETPKALPKRSGDETEEGLRDSHLLHDLRRQVDRLQAVVDKLASAKLKVNPHNVSGEDQALLVVSREHKVLADQKSKYEEALGHYLDNAREEQSCSFVNVQQVLDEGRYVLYEVWASEEALQEHYTRHYYREHAKMLVDFLASPETVSSIHLPSSWFPDN